MSERGVQHYYPKEGRVDREAAEATARAKRTAANLAIEYNRACKLLEHPRKQYKARMSDAEALKKHAKLQVKVKQLEERMYNDDQG